MYFKQIWNLAGDFRNHFVHSLHCAHVPEKLMDLSKNPSKVVGTRTRSSDLRSLSLFALSLAICTCHRGWGVGEMGELEVGGMGNGPWPWKSISKGDHERKNIHSSFCVKEVDDIYSLCTIFPVKMEHCLVVCGLNTDAQGFLGSWLILIERSVENDNLQMTNVSTWGDKTAFQKLVFCLFLVFHEREQVFLCKVAGSYFQGRA